MIQLKNVVAEYTTKRGRMKAVDGVDLVIPDGVIVGIAGESGCGKSTLMKVLYGDLGFPLSLASGSVDYGFTNDKGQPVTDANVQREWFRHVSIIPQSSMSSLNPVIRIREQFVDFPATSKDKKATLAKVREFVQRIGLPPESIDAYPHQLSGGMRQRIMVALATFLEPEVILADEPTTALDVVVQKEILLLLLELQEKMRNTIIFVSHDMGVHYQLTHQMLIMYAGKAVEHGPTEEIFRAPLHPYTLLLTSALPTIGDDRARQGLPGSPPSLWDPPKGCRFAPRCPLATEKCRTEEPPLVEVRPGHSSACHHIDRIPQLQADLAKAPSLDDLDEARLLAQVQENLRREHEIDATADAAPPSEVDRPEIPSEVADTVAPAGGER
ncbi:MAG: ABC transporter ATP-binding protein [Actinobacteria bacterium]|nr:ABC transporter ATP-binding protein [Actinomycetota bacterium]